MSQIFHYGVIDQQPEKQNETRDKAETSSPAEAQQEQQHDVTEDNSFTV